MKSHGAYIAVVQHSTIAGGSQPYHLIVFYFTISFTFYS